jgi:hypothetical protein
MMRIGQGGFFSGGGNVHLVGGHQRPAPQLAQARPQPMSPRVEEARLMRDMAVQNLRSAEDNLGILDATMGPEAALQALEEGHISVDRAQQEYERILVEESA